jgi:rod shape-determining protein MreC
MASRRPLTFLVVLSVGHVLVISAQVQSDSGVPVLSSVTFSAVARVQRLASAVAEGARGTWGRYFALHGVARENEALRARVLELEGQVQTEHARASRTRALEDALALRASVPLQTVAARVLAGSPSPGGLTVTIDRGSRDGVAANMAVVAGRGAVGRVIGRPAADAALVQLLVSVTAAAGASLEQSGAGGLALGRPGDGTLLLDLVSSTVPVAVGERVLTSGQDGIYPPGFVIGTVEAIAGTGKGRVIHLSPAVDFSHLEVVLVVLTRPAPAPSGGESR